LGFGLVPKCGDDETDV